MDHAQILALLASLTGEPNSDPAIATLQSGGFDASAPVTVSECPDLLSMNEIEGRSIVCGTVSVPEDHDDPGDARRIDLQFVLFKSHSDYAAPDPVVYLHGGPGYGVGSFVGTSGFFDKIRNTRDVVMFDQRAAGLSSASVSCFDALAVNVVDIATNEKAGAAIPGDDGELQPSATMTECLDELKAKDIDLTRYNTRQNAMDVRTVVTALGYDTYNVYGISYGTKLSLEVMRSVPQGVRSVIIDGVAPPHIRLYDTLALPLDEALTTLIDECEVNDACNAAYPDLRSVTHEVVKKAAAGELTYKGEKVPPEFALAPVLVRNKQHNGEPSLTPYIPAYIYEIHRGGDAPTIEMLGSTEYVLPRPGEEAVLAASKGFTEEQKGLVKSALSDIAISQRSARDLTAVLQQLRTSLRGSNVSGPLANLFDTELTKAALAYIDNDADKAREVLVAYVKLQSSDRSKDALKVFARSFFTGADLNRLTALIDAMSATEVAAIFDNVERSSYNHEVAFIRNVDLYVYACQEDVPYNSPEGFDEVGSKLNFPELAQFYADTAANFYGNCSAWQASPLKDFHEPVTSDIPALAIGSAWDIQTAASWADEAADALGNAQSIQIPEAGHAAIAFQPCVADMAVRFFNNPGITIDDRCVDRARLKDFYIAPWVNADK